MAIPYRTRRTLQHVATAAIAVLMAAILFWFCWVVWLERFVVYSRDGAKLNFDLPDMSLSGEVAVPPAAQTNISIYYNEGSDAVEISKEMTALNGYYIDYNSLKDDIDGIYQDLTILKSGTPIMIELKGSYGSFYYSSNLSGAIPSASVDIGRVDELIQHMKSKGFYLIAKISAFRDWDFGNRNVTSGLYMTNRAGLWLDPDGYFWLDPTKSTTTGWITSIIIELRNMGFNEVMLDNFRFPAETDKYIFTGDMDAAIRSAANTIVASCSSEKFTISFGAPDTSFPLPDGRTRLFLTNVDASEVAAKAAAVGFENKEVRLVFLCDKNDTRFDNYSVLRPLSVAEGLEAQKADMAAAQQD